MSRIFISYSQQDRAAVQRLEQALKANGLSVWRDQENLYGGQQWPKAIGEAIATNDFFLLFWSKNAADSHFVEFEWTTAIALRKAIIPCLPDDIPLPPSLRGIHGINIKDLQEALPRLLRALQTPLHEPTLKQHSSEVLNELQRIVGTDPEQVVNQAKAIFNHEGWNVQGNVYQAAGDIFLTIQQIPEQPKTESRIDPWGKIIGLMAAALTIITLAFFTLPDKVREKFSFQPATTVLRGIVRDMNGVPVSNALVEVQELPGKSTPTTSEGGFYFPKVPGKPGDRVRVYVTKPGYPKHNEYVTLPGPAPITLEK